MKHVVKRTVSVLLAVALSFTGTYFCGDVICKNGINVYAAQGDLVVTDVSGWHESINVKWSEYSGADSYNVYVRGTGDFIRVDNELIRQYPGYFTAYIPGLAKGSYTVKIVPVSNGAEITSAAAITSAVSVDNYVREGFAFSSNSPYGYTTGGYNKDGTIRSDADILYITNKNKDTVTLNGDASKGVGLFNIMAYREAEKIDTPLVVRFIGKVEMPAGTENYMLGIKNTKNVTFEGIGEDATIHGWGLTMKRACNVEVRNLGIMWYGGVGGDGDSLSLDTENKNIWLHNIDFFYGAPGKDADQAKGDGSIDLKSKSDYITADNNHFWDSGKSCVAGGVWESKNPDNPEAKIFVTYHHNWFDHSDSRHPRCVAGSVHVYNNYYDGCAKYGIGAAVQSSVFSENNYFRNVKRPMIIATQGSDVYKNGTYADKGTLSGQTGGMIKQYGDIIITPDRFVNQNTTPDEGQIDAYTVTARNEKVPDTVKAMKGGSTYNNFDTEPDFYSYAPDKTEDVPAVVMANAGRFNGGDFKWNFTSADDAISDVDADLQNAIINYESELVKAFADNSVVEEPDTTTETATETTTENKSEDTTTEATTAASSYSASDSWNADLEVPLWLNIDSSTKVSNSSSHTVFKDTDTDVANLKNRYSVPKDGEIGITLSSAANVKIYIAGNDNSAGKGTVNATLNGSAAGTYSLPGRKDSAAKPFEITTDKGGTLVLKTGYASLLYKIEVKYANSAKISETYKEISSTGKERYGWCVDTKEGNVYLVYTLTASEDDLKKIAYIAVRDNNNEIIVPDDQLGANDSGYNGKYTQVYTKLQFSDDDTDVIEAKNGEYLLGFRLTGITTQPKNFTIKAEVAE